MVAPLLSAVHLLGILILLFACGYVFVRRALGVRSVLALTGLSILLPLAAYMVFVNALGYVLPIRVAFGLVLILMAGIAGVAWYSVRRVPLAPLVDKPPLWAMWALGSIIVTASIAIARTLGSDPWFWAQYPLASTIAQGNFPVVEPTNPWTITSYHYGPQLLAGALFALTHASLEVLFALQAALGIGGMLCLLAALLYDYSRSWTVAVWGSVLAFFGAGLSWVFLVSFVHDLYAHFVLGQGIAPFRQLVFLYANNITSGLYLAFQQRSTALGYPLLFALLFFLHYLFSERKLRAFLLWSCCGIVMGAALALVLETGFLIVGFSCGVYAGLLLLLRQKPQAATQSWWRVLAATAAVCIPALLIAFFQGGVLSARGTVDSTGSFAFYPDWHISVSDTATVVPWSIGFVIAFGLPLLLFPWSVVWAWRRRRLSTMPLFFVLIALTHFALPFVAHFVPRPSEMTRIFYGATVFFSLLAGMGIAQYLLPHKGMKRLVGSVMLVMMLLSSIIYTGVRLTFPRLVPEIAPLIEHLTPPTAAETRMYEWIATHTTLRDYFYMRSVPLTPELLQTELRDVIEFMTRSGRFTINRLLVDTFPASKAPLLASIEASCAAESLRVLEIRYLVVLTADRARWFAAHCKPLEWQVAYQDASGAAFPRVYAFIAQD